MSDSFVDVTTFGALGRVGSTIGTIKAGSRQLTVASAQGWRDGSGIGVQGAGRGHSALATTVQGAPAGNVLTLADQATFDGVQPR